MLPNILYISKTERDKQPVFIVGEARSGSSLLHRTLELHPVFRPRKVENHESKIFSFPNRSHAIRMEKWTGPFDYMHCDKYVFSQFLQSIGYIKRLHQLTFSRVTVAASHRSPIFWMFGLNHWVVRSFFFYAQIARQCERIVEKTPNNTPYLRHIKLAYPGSKLLYIHRHPVDVYSSYRKVTKHLGPGSWTDISPREFCMRYRTRTTIALDWSKRDDFLLVRYEGFTRDTEQEWAKICSFLDIPSVPDPISIQYNPDRHDSFEKYLKGPITSQTKKWQEYLLDEEATYIEDTLEDVLAQLGYARYTSKCIPAVISDRT